MNLEFAYFLVLVLLLVLALIRGLNFSHHAHNDEMRMENAVKVMIGAHGGTNIIVRPHPAVSRNDHRIIVTYLDAQNENRIYYVSQKLNRQGRLDGTLIWSDPVTEKQFVMMMPSLDVPMSSKEQIISEMDAEIQRLRSVLAAAGIEDASNSV